jgi:thiamine-monophosphate kinase
VTEDDVLAAIRSVCHPHSSTRVLLGIGDDAALWQPSRSHRSVISTDMLVEGVDFTRTAMSLEDAGWRAMMANASDLAAMGARPVLATVALGLPQRMELEEIVQLYRGIASAAERCDLTIAGGDLSRADAIVISITAVGEVRPSNAKTRAGGRPGDVLAVTGPLGAARGGLELTRGSVAIDPELSTEALAAFRRPQARIAEGRFLAASANVRALMDISDGLGTDVARLAAASGCAAALEAIPVAPSALAVCAARKEDPQPFALAGGEDFELMAAIRPRGFGHLATRYAKRFGRELNKVGVLREGGGVVWRGVSLERPGWDHFAR